MQHQPPPGRHMLPAFRLQQRAIVQHRRAGRSIPAAFTPVRRMAHPVEHRREIELMPRRGFDLDHLTQTAPILTVAARAGTQLLAPDHHRTRVLGRLDRHGHHARGEGGGGKPVQPGPCAHAAGVEHQDLGPPPLLPRYWTHRHVDVPQRSRPFGEDSPRQRLSQRAKHQIGNHMTEDMAQADRGRAFGVQDVDR